LLFSNRKREKRETCSTVLSKGTVVKDSSPIFRQRISCTAKSHKHRDRERTIQKETREAE